MPTLNSQRVKHNKHGINLMSVFHSLLISTAILVFLARRVEWSVVNRDQGVFIYIAQRLIQGDTLYLDTWDHKGPSIYFMHVLFQVLSKGLQASLLVEFAALYFSLAFLLYNVLRFLQPIFVYISVISVTPTWLKFHESWGITESVMAPAWFLLLGLLTKLIFREDLNSTSIRLFSGLSGILMGFIALSRPNSAVGTLVLICFMLIRKFDGISSKSIQWFFIGMVSFISLIISWLIKINAFKPFVDQFIIYNLEYSGEASFHSRLKSVILYSDVSMPILAMVGILALVLIKRKQFIYTPIAILPTLEILMASLSGRMYLHYGLPVVYTGLFVISALFIILDFNIDSRRNVIVSKLLVVPLLGFSVNLWLDMQRTTGNSFQSKIVKFVEENSSPTDFVYVHGAESWILALSERKSPSKFSYYYPTIQAFNRNRVRDSYKLFDDLKTNPSKFIIVSPHTCLNQQTTCLSISKEESDLNTQLSAEILKNYGLVSQIEGFDIYKKVVRVIDVQ